MRNLKIRERFDAVLIIGRSFTYMTTNQDVMDALRSINQLLKKDGMLIFDNFNAEVIFGGFKRSFIQTARFKNREYKRVSTNSFNLKTGWTWNWDAKYYIKEREKVRIIHDKSILRGFTEDELKLFLRISRYDTKEVIKAASSITIVASKE